VVRLTNALGAEKILPLTMFFKRVPLEIEVPSQPLYGLDGDVVTGKPTLRPRQFTLEGRIYYPNKERIRQELDSILSFLMHPPIEVYRHHTHDRFLRAHALGAPQDWIDLGAELSLQIPMIAHDPYWYGQEVTVNISGTKTVTVDGTAPTYPLITTASSVSSLVVSNALTGQEFVVAGATGVIKVDCDERNMSVTVNGANRVDLIDDDWVLHSWALLPGENQITTNTPITLVYRPRWY
jgi:phage-related protein